MTVGITIFGIIQRNGLNSRLAEAGGNAPAGAELNADAVLSPEVMGQLPPNVREQITASLADSISNTFLWALVPAVLALVFVLMMGNERVTVPAKAKGA